MNQSDQGSERGSKSDLPEKLPDSLNKILKGLNDRQAEGVRNVHGPLLVIAGAGSGKTKMLTHRIVNLIQNHHVRPENILAVTFTNKAAGEMRERVSRAMGLADGALTPPAFWMTGRAASYVSQPTIGTFHSVCVRMLRNELRYLPFTNQFQILDDSDQLSLIRECFRKLDLNEKMFAPKSFQYTMNEAKCWAKGPQEIGRAHV